MRIYFLSTQPAALYVGGAYFGRVSDFERFAEISLRDSLPIVVQAEGMQPISFFLDETLPLKPPLGVDVYRLKGGLALHINGWQSLCDNGRIITQKREGNLLATVLKSGGVSLGIDTPNGFFNATLPPSFCECELFFIEECLLIKSPTQAAIFSLTGEQLFCERYLAFQQEETLITLTIPLSDHYKRTAELTIRLHAGRVEREGYSLRQGQEFPVDGLIAYAFFESARIGAPLPFLCEELQASSETVRKFLGDFLYVLPTENPCVCLLTYQAAPHIFDVRPFTVTVEDGKIIDVTG